MLGLELLVEFSKISFWTVSSTILRTRHADVLGRPWTVARTVMLLYGRYEVTVALLVQCLNELNAKSFFLLIKLVFFNNNLMASEPCPLTGAERAVCRLVHCGPRPHAMLRPLHLELQLYVDKTRTKQKHRYYQKTSKGTRLAIWFWQTKWLWWTCWFQANVMKCDQKCSNVICS